MALRDKVQNNDFHDRADLLEKCQDTINYVRFLWCIGNEEMDKYTCEGVCPDPEAYLKQKADFERQMAETAKSASSEEWPTGVGFIRTTG